MVPSPWITLDHPRLGWFCHLLRYMLCYKDFLSWEDLACNCAWGSPRQARGWVHSASVEATTPCGCPLSC